MALIEKKVHQLPKTVVPLHYDVVFRPHVEKAIFNAEVNVRVKIHEPVNEIYLHAHKLHIKESVIKFETFNKSFKPEKIIYDVEHHMVRLYFGQQVILPVGYGVLTFKYEGQISDKDYEGFYFNRWGHSQEWEKFWLMTSFENFKAHYAFPCWDEPWAKATWKFQFEVPKYWNIIFNTHHEKEEIVGEHRRFYFHQTPVLHPGSIAFVMGAFDKFEHVFPLSTGRMMKTNIYYPKFEHFGTMKMAEHAKKMQSGMFETIEKMFHGFMDYFGHHSHKYDAQWPMEKLDFVAVPNFDVHGAGYYGMINMHYDNFWFDKIQTDIHKFMEIVMIMSEHIGRHYFGHYLNFNSWSHHYLQESFVTFFKYMIVDRVFPEYHIWESKFVHDVLVKAMKYDQLPSTMPLDWTDKFAFFNKTIYENMFFNGNIDEHYVERFSRHGKGAVVLRMIRDYITPAVFDDVVVEIMHRFQYRSIEPEQFWTGFEFASKKPVLPMVQSWIYKEAFPIVHITGKVSPNGDYMVTLKQENILNYYKNMPTYSKFEKFAGKWNDYLNENVHKFWSIPLRFDFGEAYWSRIANSDSYDTMTGPHYVHYPMIDNWNEWAHKEFVFDREQMTFVIPAEIYRATGGYFKISPKTFGYVVFNYPEEHVRKHFIPVPIKNMGNEKMVTNVRYPMDHMRFMHDVFTMWKMGVYSGMLFFDMMKTYVDTMNHEMFRDYSTMKMIIDYMMQFRQVCMDTGAEDLMVKLQKFATYMVKEMRHFIKQEHFWNFDKDYRFGFEDEKFVGLLAHFLVVFRDMEIEKYAVDTFWKWFQTGDLSKKMFVKDLHRAMFVAVAHTNEPRVLETFFKIYQEFYRFPEARDYVIYSMGFFTNKALVEKIFQWIMTEQVVPEDRIRVFKSMMSQYPITRDSAFAFFKNKFDFFGKHYNTKWLSRDFFESMPFYYSNEKKIDEVLTFVDERMPLDVTGKHYWLNQRFMHLGYEQGHVKHQFFVNNQKVIKEFFDRL